MVEIDRISGVIRTIALDILNVDRIESTTCLLHKIKFYFVYGKRFFLIESFSKIWYLKLSVQAQTFLIQTLIQNQFKKICCKDLKVLIEYPWSFTENVF